MDSDNILSILASLGAGQQPQGAPANVLQAMQPPAPVVSDAPEPRFSVGAADLSPSLMQQPDLSTGEEHPRKRRSVIDTIGRLADVFARVGGAEALYQPTLDARQDRENSLADRQRTIDLDALRKTLVEQQVAAGAQEPLEAARKRLGTALGALNGRDDAATLWPSVAQQAGITDPAQVQTVGAILEKNPNAAGIFAKALGADVDNLGKNVYFGYDGSGKTVAYQVGPDGKPHILDFGSSGITPNEPTKAVDTGGSTVLVGQGGGVKRILPNSAKPDTIIRERGATIRTGMNNRTQITIAGMPARGKPGAGTADAGNNSVGTILKDFGVTLQGKADPVGDLIRGSTSGDLEQLGVRALGAFGKSTPGAQNIGKLQTIDNAIVLALAGGKLGAGVSNADRDFFKEMSGKISDPKIPTATRLAAWESIRTRLRGIVAREGASSTPARRPAAPARPKPRSSDAGWKIIGVK